MDDPSTLKSVGRRPAGHRRLRSILLIGIGLLYVMSVPWYRSAENPPRIVLGLPDWVAVSVFCYFAIAILNSLAWLLTDIDDGGPLPDGLADEEGPT